MPAPPLERRIQAAAAAFVAALLCYLLFVAVRLSVDFYDGYELCLNARSLARLESWGMSSRRPIGATVFFAPFFLIERLFAGGNAGFTAVHAGAVAITGAFLFVSYRIFRLACGVSASSIAVVLLACNAVLLRVAPFGKEDVPGALFFALAAYLYLRGGSLPAVGAFVGLAMSLRYQLLGLGSAVFVLAELVRPRARPRRPLVIGAAFVLLPCLILLAFIVLVYAAMGISTAWDAPFVWARHFSKMLADNALPETPWQYAAFLVKGASPAVVAAAVLGAAVGLRRRDARAAFALIWFAVIAGGLALGVDHKEARYLLPVLPAVYLLAALAVDEILKRVKSRPAAAALLAALLAQPAATALEECVRYRDPVYSAAFGETVSRYADSLAAPGEPIHWAGNIYALNPKEHLFHPDDEYTSVYHFWLNAVRFYTGRQGAYAAPDFALREKNGTTHLAPETTVRLKDGAVLIVNVEPLFQSAEIPAAREPLAVQKVKYRVFERGARVPPAPPGAYTLAVQDRGTQPWRPVALLKLEGSPGKPVADALARVSGAYRRCALIGYDSVRLFPAP